MNVWQVAKQLKYLLENAVWPDGAGEVVLGKVLVTGDTVTRIGQRPFVTIQPTSSTFDPQTPGLIRQSFAVTIVADNQNDSYAQGALLGGPRGNGAGSSRGRGLLEIEARVIATIADIDRTSGVSLWSLPRRNSPARNVGNELGLWSRTLTFEVLCAHQTSYPDVPWFDVTVTGSDVDFAFAYPESRYDRYSLMLRYAAGSTAPATIDDGTAVESTTTFGTYGAAGSLTTHNPGSGTWSYSLFVTYDETSATPDSADIGSSPLSETVTVT